MAVEVKICGLTRPADAALATRLGADLLGVVFAAGPRRLTVAQARSVVEAAGVPVFGVFGDATLDDILRIVGAAGLAGVQLHGGGPAPEQVRLASGLPVWRVVHLAGPADLVQLDPVGVDAVLVEPRVSGRLGGSGQLLEPTLAQAARRHLAGHRLVLAGGLRPETVAAAIRSVRPDGVDVSSGVERTGAPGIKDPGRLQAFLEATRDR